MILQETHLGSLNTNLMRGITFLLERHHLQQKTNQCSSCNKYSMMKIKHISAILLDTTTRTDYAKI